MGDKDSVEIKRFKAIRDELNLTQTEFAERLGINNSTADIERGRTKLSGAVVMELLRQFQVNPLWLFGKSFNKILEPARDTSPKVITLDAQENENIMMVPIKASVGYASNLMDSDWYGDLPVFNIPLPQYQGGSYRSFQVRGDSMTPVLEPGEWVMGRSVESVRLANNNRIHVVVTPDSVLVKKLVKGDSPSQVNLISLNRDYPVIEADVANINELWEVNSKLSFNLDEPESGSLQSLKQGLESLRGEIEILKGKA